MHSSLHPDLARQHIAMLLKEAEADRLASQTRAARRRHRMRRTAWRRAAAARAATVRAGAVGRADRAVPCEGAR